jgi:hypothetical protein
MTQKVYPNIQTLVTSTGLAGRNVSGSQGEKNALWKNSCGYGGGGGVQRRSSSISECGPGM